MEGVELLNKAYDYSENDRRCLKLCRWCFPNKYQKMKRREIYGRWPYPKRAESPENIQW
jgi:hypothetical protein